MPGPSKTLPMEYRLRGVSIGDVGIIYRSGGFSFLFNVFLPADHPINCGAVPVSFSPLDISAVARNIDENNAFSSNEFVASASMERYVSNCLGHDSISCSLSIALIMVL